MTLNKVLGLIVNTQKPKAIETALKLLRWAPENGITFRLPPMEASILGMSVNDRGWKDGISVAIVIGGDGTFLRAARYVLDDHIALYGVNLGRLGFLAAGDRENVEDDVLKIVAGDYQIQRRQLMLGELYRSNHREHVLYALNDLVLTKGALARVMEVDIKVCGKPTSVLRADGIIASTPTGSTAYALSAGGPIVPPHVPCMIMAPICAHTLYARPMVLGPEDVLTLSPKGESRDITLTQDGQLGYEILPGDRIDISLAKNKAVDTLWLPGRDYYDLLSKKLMWGQTFYVSDDEE
ncbi:MAG: NAD(+)/NADH kinase [Synergistota bacterium]|nr:NAD(+)/NADH kinase [Synergistota bacterium]